MGDGQRPRKTTLSEMKTTVGGINNRANTVGDSRTGRQSNGNYRTANGEEHTWALASCGQHQATSPKRLVALKGRPGVTLEETAGWKETHRSKQLSPAQAKDRDGRYTDTRGPTAPRIPSGPARVGVLSPSGRGKSCRMKSGPKHRMKSTKSNFIF